jgi:hypothetical protein
MRRFRIGRRISLSASALTGVLLLSSIAALPGALAATTTPAASKPPQPPKAAQPPKAGPPSVSTGGFRNVRGTSADLEGSVNPRGAATTYFFQYGPTVAYGSQTATASLPAGMANVKVSQTVARILAGYHYRLVAMNEHGPKDGRDRIFSPKTSAGALKFEIATGKEEMTTSYGGSTVISGSLTGTGGALHQIVLQASPFPYQEAFIALGTPIVTSATGSFAFHVPNLIQGTQFRVATLDPSPIYSKIVTERVAVRVTLKVRTIGHAGLVRLYGTVTPAEAGAPVMIELAKHIRPHGKSEATTRFAPQANAVVRRATKSFSRFSMVIKVTKTGRYRAFVQLKTGRLTSGASTTVVLKAAPSPAAQKVKHKKG